MSPETENPQPVILATFIGLASLACWHERATLRRMRPSVDKRAFIRHRLIYTAFQSPHAIITRPILAQRASPVLCRIICRGRRHYNDDSIGRRDLRHYFQRAGYRHERASHHFLGLHQAISRDFKTSANISRRRHSHASTSPLLASQASPFLSRRASVLPSRTTRQPILVLHDILHTYRYI